MRYAIYRRIFNFRIKNKNIPDTYLYLGFSKNRKIIEHVWVIPSDAEIIQNKTDLTITNSENSISKVKKFEVDSTPYNEIYQSMSIENCEYLTKEKT